MTIPETTETTARTCASCNQPIISDDAYRWEAFVTRWAHNEHRCLYPARESSTAQWTASVGLTPVEASHCLHTIGEKWSAAMIDAHLVAGCALALHGLAFDKARIYRVEGWSSLCQFADEGTLVIVSQPRLEAEIPTPTELRERFQIPIRPLEYQGVELYAPRPGRQERRVLVWVRDFEEAE